MDVDLKALTRLGAQVRLAELVAEMDAILKAFPGMAKQGPAQTTAGAETAAKPKARKRRMTAAQRKAVSSRMKKYWQERKTRG